MKPFTANHRMLIMIVIFFMSLNEQGALVLLAAYEDMKRDGLV